MHRTIGMSRRDACHLPAKMPKQSQVSCPDLCPPSHFTSHTNTLIHTNHVLGFLSATRNIFEPLRVLGDLTWNRRTAEIPMESDAIAIEFLAQHDYDFEKALFRLTCDLGCGKGTTRLRMALNCNFDSSLHVHLFTYYLQTPSTACEQPKLSSVILLPPLSPSPRIAFSGNRRQCTELTR